MARRHFGSGFPRGRTNRRETSWILLADLSTALGAGVSVMSASLNAAALAMRPFTIVRVRGFIHLRSNQVAASETYAASMGWAVVSDQATAIGVTAVPTPITDRGSDLFFVYESLMGRIEPAATSTFEAGKFSRFESKAMRKVNDDQDIIVTVENSGISTNGVVWADGARALIKLH